MTGPVLLDVSRMAAWRWRGVPATGIDRVCEAYARHFAGHAYAAIQLAGRVTVLDRPSSRTLFHSFEEPPETFRRAFAGIMATLPGRLAGRRTLDEATYLNVGHSGFDRDLHWSTPKARDLKRVCLLHDLIPLTHPHLTTAHKSARHRGRVVRALRQADGIVVNSCVTADALRAFAGQESLPSPPVLTAPIATDRPMGAARSNPAGEPCFVCVGTIEPRKNHALLLRAWSRLIDRMGDAAPRLVIAGKRGLKASDALSHLKDDPRLAAHVEVRSGLSDAGIAQLLHGARALLFPSLAEGFGLPVAEALQAGVPVIASDLPITRKVGQGIPQLLDPEDPEGWAQAIAGHCGACADRARQLAAMPQFRANTWAEHFAALEEWLAKLPAQRLGVRAASAGPRLAQGEIRQDRRLQC